MARFHGAQGKGALRRLREIKREEAQERDAVPTLPSFIASTPMKTPGVQSARRRPHD